MLFSSHIKRTGIRKLQLLVAEKLYGLLNADRQTILAQKKRPADSAGLFYLPRRVEKLRIYVSTLLLL